jgi:hypothetical protein
VGLLSLGKSDFEAIEPFRGDRFFKEALGLSKVPGAVWMRQRLDAKAEVLRGLADELSLRLLERTQAPIAPYQGFDGYTPIVAYLGNEGWSLGLELRSGFRHSACGTHYFYERLFPRIERWVQPKAPVLLREDSGFESAQLLFAKAREKDRLAALGRSFDFLTRRVAHLSLEVERAWHKEKRTLRLIVRVRERTIDRKGEHPLMPEIELEGGWTTLNLPIKHVIELDQHHGTHEQFHSDKFAWSEFRRRQAPAGAALRTSADQFKSDLDLERLPSGKLDTNDVILHLAAFAYRRLRGVRNDHDSHLPIFDSSGQLPDFLWLRFMPFAAVAADRSWRYERAIQTNARLSGYGRRNRVRGQSETASGSPARLPALREAFRAGAVRAKRHRVYAGHRRRSPRRHRGSRCRSSALSGGRPHRLFHHPETSFGTTPTDSISTQQCFLVLRHFRWIGRRDPFLAPFVSRRPESV